ncbi:auxin efflux carrier component 5-like [Apium graveolens]|uniref:auxin efflux carrier component 5-like n=1 Tax=Apium graveolens TaxID=4045 RepID=UPI003D78D399
MLTSGWKLCFRLHFEMPSIMEECILIVSKAAVGTYMFCLGLFMAINKKIDENWSIGVPITGILWRFIMGPICWGLACLYLGLDGEVLKATIIQATLPPAYLSFYYAQEYRIDIDCISHG